MHAPMTSQSPRCPQLYIDALGPSFLYRSFPNTAPPPYPPRPPKPPPQLYIFSQLSRGNASGAPSNLVAILPSLVGSVSPRLRLWGAVRGTGQAGWPASSLESACLPACTRGAAGAAQPRL